MTDFIRIETTGGVRTIRFNRPEKKNAITGPMYSAMTAAIRSAAADLSVGAILFAGSPGAFTAGNDLSEFVTAAKTGTLGAPVIEFLRTIATAELPLVAAVDGLAVGIGTTLLFHCDMVLASERATFRAPFADLGLVPEAASSLIAPRLMGHHHAFELLVGGATFHAHRAREAGFVNRVTPPDAIEAEGFAAAQALAAKPRRAVAIGKRLLKGDPAEILARIDEEAVLFGERLRSSEAQAAFQSLLARSS